jgi:hypothetical protein
MVDVKRKRSGSRKTRSAPSTYAREARSAQAADHAELLRRIKDARPHLKAMLERAAGPEPEDRIYRFYHHSFKAFDLQGQTVEIVTALRDLMPDRPLNEFFLEIVAAGTGKQFSVEQNPEWTRHTRPILEAFFHARYFLEMAVRYASLRRPPSTLPSGWAALLTLYGLR